MSEADGERDGRPPRLGSQAVAGAAAAIVAERLTGPGGAVIAGAALPFLEELAGRAWGEFRSDASRRQAEMLASAATAAGCDPGDLQDLTGKSEDTRLLTATAMAGAATTAWPPKVRALGRALADGLIAEDTEIDIAELVLPAMASMDRAHVSLLELVTRWVPVREVGLAEKKRPYEGPRSQVWSAEWNVDPRTWTAQDIGAARPTLQPGFRGLIGTVERHGLVAQNDNTAAVLAKFSEELRQESNRRGLAGARNGQGIQVPPTLNRWTVQRLVPTPTWSPSPLGAQVLGYYELAAEEFSGTVSDKPSQP